MTTPTMDSVTISASRMAQLREAIDAHQRARVAYREARGRANEQAENHFYTTAYNVALALMIAFGIKPEPLLDSQDRQSQK